MAEDCDNYKLISLLMKLTQKEDNDSEMTNSSVNTSCFDDSNYEYDYTVNEVDQVLRIGRLIYGYATPIIIIIGVIGNSLSFNVFLSKTLRKHSASYYLITLSVTDLTVLVVYVLLEWIDRGIPILSDGIKIGLLMTRGVCETFLYLSYSCRLLSAWTIVVFTAERYLGVCKPMRRRELCTKAYTRKLIFGVVFMSALLCLYKPILSGVVRSKSGAVVCASRESYAGVSQVLDAIFALTTTIVPFVIVAVLNILIVRKLCIKRRKQRGKKVVSQENIIRLELTIILLAVSTGFIAVTLPYFVTWCIQARTLGHIASRHANAMANNTVGYMRGVRYITKTIFYLNYCMNFFLYSLAGAYFRREVKHMFSRRLAQTSSVLQCNSSNRSHRSSKVRSISHQSWV